MFWIGRNTKEEASGIFKFLRVKEAQIEGRKGMKEVKRVGLAFQNWCTKTGWNLSRKVFTYESVASFVCAHVIKNKGSTRSVGNVLSALKKGCLIIEEDWLMGVDQLRLMALLSELKFEDLSKSRRKRPIRLRELIAIIGQLDLEDPVDLLIATMLALGHDGLLRSAELLSGFQVKHFEWSLDKKTVRLEIERSKMNRSGESEFVSLFDYGEYSAVSLLRRWFTVQGLWENWEHKVFPAVRYKKLHFDRDPNYSWWRRTIKKLCKRIGLEEKNYSGHSLRAGGATDLFVCRVPYYIIKKMGRWKSEAAMLYYRCDEDVKKEVADAFTKLFIIETGWLGGGVVRG
jgi:hypothetical protein